MPRRAKGARLYPRSRKGRGVVWVIRDGEYEESTGCGEAGRAGAERKLQEYLAKKFIPNHERHPSELTISEVLMMYAKTRAPNHAAPKLVSYHLGPLLDFWGEKLISDIKGQSCRNYVEWRLSQKRKESTARRELITLRGGQRMARGKPSACPSRGSGAARGRGASALPHSQGGRATPSRCSATRG